MRPNIFGFTAFPYGPKINVTLSDILFFKKTNRIPGVIYQKVFKLQVGLVCKLMNIKHLSNNTMSRVVKSVRKECFALLRQKEYEIRLHRPLDLYCYEKVSTSSRRLNKLTFQVDARTPKIARLYVPQSKTIKVAPNAHPLAPIPIEKPAFVSHATQTDPPKIQKSFGNVYDLVKPFIYGRKYKPPKMSVESTVLFDVPPTIEQPFKRLSTESFVIFDIPSHIESVTCMSPNTTVVQPPQPPCMSPPDTNPPVVAIDPPAPVNYLSTLEDYSRNFVENHNNDYFAKCIITLIVPFFILGDHLELYVQYEHQVPLAVLIWSIFIYQAFFTT
jgi:hypothetical protein